MRLRVQLQRPGFPGGRGGSVRGAAGRLGHLRRAPSGGCTGGDGGPRLGRGWPGAGWDPRARERGFVTSLRLSGTLLGWLWDPSRSTPSFWVQTLPCSEPGLNQEETEKPRSSRAADARRGGAPACPLPAPSPVTHPAPRGAPAGVAAPVPGPPGGGKGGAPRQPPRHSAFSSSSRFFARPQTSGASTARLFLACAVRFSSV